MAIQTSNLLDLIQDLPTEDTLASIQQDMLYSIFETRIGHLRSQEQELVNAHKSVPRVPFGKPIVISYKNRLYFHHHQSSKVVPLKVSLHKKMDQWIDQYHELKSLIYDTIEYFELLFSYVAYQHDALTLLPPFLHAVYLEHVKSYWFHKQFRQQNGSPLTEKIVSEFNEEHADVIQKLKIFHLDQLTC